MKLVAFFAPLALLAACSQPFSSADQTTRLSDDAMAAMTAINSAVYEPDAPDAPSIENVAAQAVADSPALPKADVAAIESAQPASSQQPEAYNAALVRIEVLLDRAHFSPGVIDGFDGENVRKAVSAYQAANKMPVNGRADAALLKKLLAADSSPALITYTLTASDIAGPYAPTPSGLEEMAKVDHLGFQRVSEAIAEKFHMDEDLLKKLNPSVDFSKSGVEVAVANAGGELTQKVANIVIDKREKSLRAFDAEGKMLAYYPASIGSDDAPAPSGDYAVRAVAFDPTYHYDPKRLPTFGDTGHGALTVPAGPNNPVGSVWIALTLDTYGIHGSPEAQQVSKTQSHGCVRLTNWDATELGKAVSAGIPVSFRETGLRAEKTSPQG